MILNLLAMALFAAEDLNEAERASQKAVSAKMGERGFGPRSPQLAAAQFDQARIYYEHGKYEDAETSLKQALEINEQELGPQDADVGNCLQAYVLVLRAMRRDEEANVMEMRAKAIKNKLTQDQQQKDLIAAQAELASREKELGAENPALEPPVRKLAFAYFYLSQYAAAEPLFQRALTLNEKALGHDHPSVAISVMDLARVYQSAQKYPEAEARWKRALALLEKVVEPDHYRLLKPLKGYAELLDRTGRRDEWKVITDRIKTIEKKYPEYGDARKKAS